jgi:peptide/nickel transport system substrate-binding protein
VHGTTRRAKWLRLLALLAVIGLFAAACGGGDDSESGGGDSENEPADPLAGSENPDEGAEPVMGGEITYALEANTSPNFVPQEMQCAISCHMIAHSVFDPLTLPNADGETEPFLLESAEANDDSTVWTLTPREGVTFHDGTPFDAEAIKANLEGHRTSALTEGTVLQIEDITVTDGAAVVTMNSPWPNFPSVLSGQVGYMASPTWLAAVEAGTGDALEPIGTGPFAFESYNAGDGTFVAVKNEDYWSQDAEGNQLPYLDQITFVVQVSAQTRAAAVTRGDVDITHTDNGVYIEQLRGESGIETYTMPTAHGETSYIMLHPGNEDSAVSDVRIRQAMALAIDQDARNQARNAGVSPVANGPFTPGSVGYMEDTGFPTFDPDAARALVEEYEAENGPATIAYKTTTDDFNRTTAELYQQFWNDVGIDVTLDLVDQGSLITSAVTDPTWEAFGWRNHAGVLPDNQRVWWSSETTELSLNLNFGEIRDEVIDEQLDILRAGATGEEEAAAAEAINERFAEQVYNIWTDWTTWAIAHQPTVHNVNGGGFVLPSGNPVLTDGWLFGAGHQTATMWVDQ